MLPRSSRHPSLVVVSVKRRQGGSLAGVGPRSHALYAASAAASKYSTSARVDCRRHRRARSAFDVLSQHRSTSGRMDKVRLTAAVIPLDPTTAWWVFVARHAWAKAAYGTIVPMDTGTGAGVARAGLAEHGREDAQHQGPPRQDRAARLLDVLLHQLPARARRAAPAGGEVRRRARHHRRALAEVRARAGPGGAGRRGRALRRGPPGARRPGAGHVAPVRGQGLADAVAWSTPRATWSPHGRRGARARGWPG